MNGKSYLILVKSGQLTFRKYIKYRSHIGYNLFHSALQAVLLLCAVSYVIRLHIILVIIALWRLWLNNIFSGVDCGCVLFMFPYSCIGSYPLKLIRFSISKSLFMATVYTDAIFLSSNIILLVIWSNSIQKSVQSCMNMWRMKWRTSLLDLSWPVSACVIPQCSVLAGSLSLSTVHWDWPGSSASGAHWEMWHWLTEIMIWCLNS